MSDFRQAGYQLMQDGLSELARVEANGIRIDIPLLAETKTKLQEKIRTLKAALEEDRVWRIWCKRFGSKASLTSGDQLAVVLHEEMDFEVSKLTEKGRASTDEEALQQIDHPFVKSLLRYSKYNKALGTFLKGIEREIVNGRLHPAFNLHTARSFRSSSDSPNFQNFPVRDKEIARIIRSLFIASSDRHVIVENDFKGIEVALSASYHKDPNFISYITTPGKDMHRDMAAQIYMLDAEDVSKDARYGAKNKFVFPQFYGDYYITCAKALWDWIEKGKLVGNDGKSLYSHLRRNGFHELGICDPEQEPEAGTFEAHLKDVEHDFWNRRFQKYGKWKRDWYDLYQERGYFDLLTGFRIEGFFSRNQATNLPIQGSAFHCLLWSLIQINRQLRKYRMESLVIGQIHDSLLGDVLVSELRDYLEIVERVTTVDLRRHYDWMVVPPEIEYEIALPGQSWYDKQEFGFKQGQFVHPNDRKKQTGDPQLFLRVMEAKNNRT